MLSAGSNIFGDKETVVFILYVLTKSHLLVVRGSEYFLFIRTSVQLFREDFALNYGTWLEVVHLETDALAHDFGI